MIAAMALSIAAAAQSSASDIALPAPQKSGGKSLSEALALRQTVKGFSNGALSSQQLSNLLWSAFGVNREKPPLGDKPGRTAPSAHNGQEVDLYVLLASGVYLYEAAPHRLKLVAAGDVRAKLLPPPAAKAAVTIVFVAAEGQRFAQVDTGFIGQNIYLYAAAANLNAWFYNVRNAADVTSALQLSAGKQPLYFQSLGLPQAK
jgi:nitroreductase